MKILQILPELNVGGVETGTLDFGKYIVEQDHESLVVSNGGTLVERLESQGSKHIQLPVHKKSILSIFKQIKKLRQIIIEENVDIVHARSRVPAWIAYFACRKTRAEFITTCHGYYKGHFTSQVMGWSKLVIVPSHVIGRHMIEDFHVKPINIRCIPRSVDLDKFQDHKQKEFNRTQPTIAIIGRITPLKGHEYFFKAMVKVLREYPQAKIWVIGSVPKSKEGFGKQLELLIKRLGIEDRIEFLGKRADIPEILKSVDIVVMSSTEPESFGRVIIEAQAANIPVVATKVGGIVDIIDHEKTGLLVAPKDTEAMAHAVLRFIKEPDLCATVVTNAMAKLKEQYTLKHMAESTLAVYDELLEKHHILIIKLSAMGDVVLATASFKAIREKFPKAHITCLVGQESYEIIKDCPHLSDIIVYDQKGHERGIFAFLKLTRKLRKLKLDQIIDFQNNRRSHLISCLSFPKDSYGYDNGKFGKLLSVKIKNDKKAIAPVAHQFRILEKLGINYTDDQYLDIWPSDKDKTYIDELFQAEWLSDVKLIVGINVAASVKWQTKNWPPEYIAELCDLLANQNIRVVLTGTKDDQWMYSQIAEHCKSKPTNLIGKTTFLQLASLIKKCQLYITPDSAPMHVAAAVQTPFIAYFGPTASQRHIPPAKKFIVMERKLNCAPCYKSRCKILTHACMKDIKPEEVLGEALNLLGR